MNSQDSIIWSALLALLFCGLTDSLMFHLQPTGQKCLREEIHKDVLVSGDFEITEIPGQTIDLHVIDSKGGTLWKKDHAEKGRFTFTTDEYEVYEICFSSKVPHGSRGFQQEVYLNTKHGVEAKSYEGLDEAAKLKPLEVELKRLEDLSESIVKDFSFMRLREEQMRDTNESTNSRVLYFSVFSMLCLLGLATWQVIYLRSFFKSKKLIE